MVGGGREGGGGVGGCWLSELGVSTGEAGATRA